MATAYTKPLPRPISPALSRPFWEAAKRHELVMPRCKTCDQLFFYPRSECPRCLSTDLEWVKVSGRGRLHSFTIVQQPANAAFNADVPYVYAVVQLDEGPRLMSNITDCNVQAVHIGMPVAVAFVDAGDGLAVPVFTPSSAPTR